MTTSYIRKLRAGRVANANVATWVGENGTIFYDEATGQLKIADGVTPGGQYIALVKASPTVSGGIKLGPGVTLNPQDQLIIDTAGLDFKFGDFNAFTNLGPSDGACLSSVNANQDVNIVSNGTGSVNVVGDFHIHKSDSTVEGALSVRPIFEIKADGQIFSYVTQQDANLGSFEIIGSTTGNIIAPGLSGAMLHITGQRDLPNRTYLDGNNNYVSLVGRRWNGNVDYPTQVLAGEDIFRLNATAFTTTGLPPAQSTAQIRFTSLENQTTTAQGSSITFTVTPVGSTASSRVDVANITVADGITVTKAKVLGNITAGNLSATYLTGTLSTASQPNITTVGTLTGLTVNGNVQTSGANIGYITIYNNAIYSGLTTTDLTIGQLSATANLVINRTTVHNKDVAINTGNLNVGTGGMITTPAVTYNAGGLRLLGNGGATVNVNLATDSIVQFVQSQNTVINLQNPTAGRIVKVIMQVGTTAYTLNTGLSSVQNSTTGATTFAVGGGGGINPSQCVTLEYISTNTAVTGTFASITYK